MPPPFEYRPATWCTAGAGHRPWRAAVVKLSSRIDVEWLEPTPIEKAQDGDLTVSRAGTLDAAIVTPPTGKPLSSFRCMPFGRSRTPQLVAVGSTPMRQFTASSLTSQSSWGNSRATVFLRRVTSTSCTGMGITKAATGPLAMRRSSTECAPWGCPSWARKRPRVAARTRGLTSSHVQATTSPRTARIATGQPRPPGSSTSCSPPNGLTEQCQVSARNEPDAWGPSDHCQVHIVVASGLTNRADRFVQPASGVTVIKKMGGVRGKKDSAPAKLDPDEAEAKKASS